MPWEWNVNKKELAIDAITKKIEQYEKESGVTLTSKQEIVDFCIWFVTDNSPKFD